MEPLIFTLNKNYSFLHNWSDYKRDKIPQDIRSLLRLVWYLILNSSQQQILQRYQNYFKRILHLLVIKCFSIMPCIIEHSFCYRVEEILLSQAYSELKCPTTYTCSWTVLKFAILFTIQARSSNPQLWTFGRNTLCIPQSPALKCCWVIQPFAQILWTILPKQQFKNKLGY